jgi:hypothetical protein
MLPWCNSFAAGGVWVSDTRCLLTLIIIIIIIIIKLPN